MLSNFHDQWFAKKNYEKCPLGILILGKMDIRHDGIGGKN